MGLFWACFLICGLSLATTADAFCDETLYITGGHKVSLKDAPYMASINEVQSEDNYEKICAGTVIHSRFVLTAASCINRDRADTRTVKVSTESSYIDVAGEFCHEGFDEEDLVNDICLMKLKKEVPYAALIKLRLPEKELVLDVGTLVNATGWGATRRDGDMERELHQVTIPVLKQRCCDEVYDWFNANQICAGARRRDFCEGDMGGPLTYNGAQVGVISGDGECGKNPGIYTKVTSYLDWIHDTINSNL